LLSLSPQKQRAYSEQGCGGNLELAAYLGKLSLKLPTHVSEVDTVPNYFHQTGKRFLDQYW
jgi:hypothetical protein